MRKTVFGAAVVGLAASCWVVARHAEAGSPYRQVSPVYSAPAAPVAPEPPMAVEPVVIPPTRLDVSPIQTASSDIVNPVVIPHAPAVEPPTPRAIPAPIAPEPIHAPVEPPVVPAPIHVPAPMSPRANTSRSANAPIRPALSAIPALPSVPGVASSAVQIPGEATPGMSSPAPLVPGQVGPVQSWTVDGPTAALDGQQIFDGVAETTASREIGPRIWGGGEYLYWFVQRQKYPVLARTINGVRQGDTSYEGWQVQDLFPGNDNNPLSGSGVRGTLGFWLDTQQSIGFEANYFWLDTFSQSNQYQSAGSSILARPFISPFTGETLLFQLSNIYGAGGTLRITQQFQADGGEANFLANSARISQRLNLIAGFRFFETHERLDIGNLTVSPSDQFFGKSLDTFSTANQFYGGQLGLRWSYEGRRFFASITGKVAFGSMQESVRINGGSFASSYGYTAAAPGGVLALPSNIGHFTRSTTAWLPEANVTLGYNLTSWATAFVGYNFLYVSNLVRPGSQIDTVIDPDQFPFGGAGGTVARPAFHFKEDSLWLQGINFGLALRF